MFLSVYLVSYIVTRSYLFYSSIFIILLFYNSSYLLSYILSGPILYPLVSVLTRIDRMRINYVDDEYDNI